MRPALPLSLFALPLTLLAQGPGGPGSPGGGPGGPPPRIVLQALDTDHDGQLSLAEIAAASAGLLSLDVNHDGQLTSLEYLPNQADPKANNADEMAQRLMAFDKNGDGVLTRDEVPERMAGIFARADKNGDGKINADELKSTASKTAGPNGRVERGTNVTRMDPILSALDADHDGVISAAEIAAAPAALKALDKDATGSYNEERGLHVLSQEHGAIALPYRFCPGTEAGYPRLSLRQRPWHLDGAEAAYGLRR
ncbi:EF-hand domain-containing protein [Terriglobus sp. YAF25]|uniref:EF-hand domain-containing protein n=1 Tax=Terriglobus sp. YAF25 TaxID=3233080 RepID=UPI003F993C6A